LAARILFETRKSVLATRRGMSYFAVRRLFHRSPRPHGYCIKRLSGLTMKNNQNTCRGPNRNIAYKFTVRFNTRQASRWQFRLGSDFGRGGLMSVDHRVVRSRLGHDLWWNRSWRNRKVMTSGWLWLRPGNHYFRAYGFEGCCDGPQSLQYRVLGQNGNRWQPATVGNLNRDGRRAGAGAGYITVRARDWTGRWAYHRVRKGRSKIIRQSRRYRTSRRCRWPRDRAGVQVDARGRVRAFYRDRCAPRTTYGRWATGRTRSTARWHRYAVLARVWRGRGHRRRRRNFYTARLVLGTKYSRLTTRRGMSVHSMFRAFRRMPRRHGYCHKLIPAFGVVANHLRGIHGCGGPNRNLAYKFSVSFFAPGGYRYRFRLGNDFGLGGGAMLNGRPIVNAAGRRLWWGRNWRSGHVLYTPWLRLRRGRHRLTWIGFENCCDGPASMQYRIWGRRWTTVTKASLERDARRRRRRIYRRVGRAPRLVFSTKFYSGSIPRNMGGRAALSKFHHLPARRGYCAKRVFTMTRLSNHERGRNRGCGGYNRNIGYHFHIRFYVPHRKRWRFRIGSDFGKGGAGLLDGRTIVKRMGVDLWWAWRWRNRAVMYTPWQWINPGWHTMTWVGFEGCCDGPANLQYRIWGGRWKGVTSRNLYRDSYTSARRRRHYGRTPSPPRGSRFGLSAEYWRYPEAHRTIGRLGIAQRVFTTGSRYINFNHNQFNIRQRHKFAIRYRARIWIARRGVYRFYLKSVDGSRLFVGRRMVVSNDHIHPMRERSGAVRLNPGWNHIRVEYFHGVRGWPFLALYWKGPGFSKRLCQTYGYGNRPVARRGRYGWKVQVWGARNPRNLAAIPWRAAPRFTAYRTLPFLHLTHQMVRRYLRSTHNFGARFLGAVHAWRAGTYTFYLGSDDGSKMFVQVGNSWRQVINNDGLHPTRWRTGRFRLRRGYTNIKVEFFNKHGPSYVGLKWAGPGFGRRMTPVMRPRGRVPTPPANRCYGPARGVHRSRKLGVCCGVTNVNQWRRYGGAGMYVDVNMRHCNFARTPRVFSTMRGTSHHWLMYGMTSQYSMRNTGFRTYIYNNGMWNWRARFRYQLSWCAIGKQRRVTPTSSGFCCGTESPGIWRRYGGAGEYADINMRKCKFSATPQIFTSLYGRGNQWVTRGSSSTYSTRPQGFRVYLYRWAVNSVRAWQYSLHWCAVGPTRAPRRSSGYPCNGARMLTRGRTTNNFGRVCCGTTSYRGWRQYGSHGVYRRVNTARCRFSRNVWYFSQVKGNSHQWVNTGMNSIYSANRVGFGVYQHSRFHRIPAAHATAWRWQLVWCGVDRGRASRTVRRPPGYHLRGQIKNAVNGHRWTGALHIKATRNSWAKIATSQECAGAERFIGRMSLARCQARCDRTSGCVAVDYGKGSARMRCYLVRNGCRRLVRNGRYDAYKRTGGAHTRTGAVRGGRYDISGMVPGKYTVKVWGAGICAFEGTVRILRGHATFNINVSPTLRGRQLRIVLTWGSQPRDLDSHLQSPNRCKTYYRNRSGCTGVTLDRDVTGGYGPETMTIHRPLNGWYRYRVHNYSRVNANIMRHGVSNTPATVTVYKGCRRRVFICGRDGDINTRTHYWDVFDYNGGTGVIRRHR